jgi:hypothetical protein
MGVGERMNAFFEMKEPLDLLHKLEREHERWKSEPLKIDFAWNFFVTAEHLPDWMGRAHAGPPLLGGDSIEKFKASRPLLRICSHIANGGKHLVPDPKRHTSVDRTVRERSGYIEAGYIEDGYYAEELMLRVYLTPDEMAALGRDAADIDALGLADRIMEFYRAWPALNAKP